MKDMITALGATIVLLTIIWIGEPKELSNIIIAIIAGLVITDYLIRHTPGDETEDEKENSI